ncbi:MAG: DNA-directed RNA polymerase subunit omega [Clostridiales bacterium]|nr:DNA-directed RNA polymerase subunit omega [Candidatus Apopatousia equi]
MLNKPSVEELTKIVGDKYKLSVLTSKRAREIQKRNIEQEVQVPDQTEITEAAYEFLDGKTVADR